jgi:trimethylamine corrinoid protein
MTASSTPPDSGLENALLEIDRISARKIIRDSCSQDSPMICLETMIIPVLEDIGRKWEQGDVALSQVYMSGRMCEEIVDVMLPSKHPDRINQPKIAVVVFEDHHTLGKRILVSMLRAGGYEIIDYQSGVSAETLVSYVVRDQVDILLISTLMLPAAIRVKDAIRQIREKMPKTRVIVGGAPFRFDSELLKEVGADAMGVTATDAVEIVRNMTGEV